MITPSAKEAFARKLAFALVLVAVVATAIALLDIHLAPKPIYLQAQEQIWRTPNGLPAADKDSINSRKGQSYEGIEQLLRTHYKLESERLEVGPLMESSLRKMMALLPREVSEEDVQQLVFVVSHAFAGEQGETLSDLVRRYVRYHQDVDEIGGTDLERQNHYFGVQLAGKLFSKQRAIRAYVERRRQIKAASNLSPERKQEALIQLQLEFDGSIGAKEKGAL